MEYGVKVPCPSCKEILKIIPAPQGYAGQPMEQFSDKKRRPAAYEKTVPYQPEAQSFSMKVDPDQTVVRAIAPPKAPEVSVKRRVRSISFSLKPQIMAGMGACILLVLSVFFIVRNQQPIEETDVEMMSKYYKDELEEGKALELPDSDLFAKSFEEASKLQASQLHDKSTQVGGLKDETLTKLGMTEEQLKNTKRTKSDLHVLYLPPLSKVTSPYGVRLDPFTKKIAFHGGIDFKAKKGSEVNAALNGTVEYAGRKGLYGNVVILKHKKGYKTLYAHLHKPLVKKGQKVTRKDVIGLAGSTGRSTGPHLHFELHHKGKKKDPLQADLIPKG